MAATMIGTVTGLSIARWGTDGAGTSSLGIILSLRRRKDNNKSYIKNPNAETIAEIQYDDFDEINVEIMALDAAVLPDNSDAITLAGIAAVVQNSEENWRIEDMCKFTISLKKFAAMTLGS